MRLEKINLAGACYRLSNIVVIIGPNNAGKTKLLENLNVELVNSYERTAHDDCVSSTVGNPHWSGLIEKGFFVFSQDELSEWLNSHEDWRKPQNDPGGEMLRRSKNHILQRNFGEEGALTQQQIDEIKVDLRAKSDWLVKFKRSHIETATIDTRFNSSDVLNNIDASTTDSASLLYGESRTISNLNKHISKLFSKELVCLKVSKTHYVLLLVDIDQKQRPQWAKSNHIEADNKTIAEHTDFLAKNSNGAVPSQSHGTRAALSILMILADKFRKIIFIDEPESHIYPAARKYLAGLVAQGSTEKQFFIVTHDVDFLEGIAGSRKDFTVVRINRNREAKIVDFNASERRRTSSELKNSKALKAGFFDLAIFVEGVSDKYIYESVLSRKKLIPPKIEYGVIDCSGNDGIADSVKFALDIGTSIAVITDFDTLLDTKKIRGTKTRIGYIDRILGSFGKNGSLNTLLIEVRTIMSNKSNSKKGLNAAGLSATESAKVTELLEDLKKIGIFVVPYGELYDWFSATKEDASVEELRNRYFNNSTKYSQLTAFMTEVSSYILAN